MSKLRTNLIKGNGDARSIKRTETESIGEFNVCGEFVKKFMPTLPRTFKSLFDTSISIENDKPQELIKLLGDLLGIDDYATNMASFWFLDTLVLYMIRYRENLDEYYMSVLKDPNTYEEGCSCMIFSTICYSTYTNHSTYKDRKHTREGFFRELKNIFIAAANKICEQKQMPYWDEIVDEREADRTFVTSLREPSSEADIKLSGTIDPLSVLDIVIEATYDMYGNELRYALVYAVFVEPIEIQTYNLPFTFRTPRPVKPADPKMIPFNIQLQRSLKRLETMDKSKKDNKTGKKLKTNYEIPPTPPPSLDDEVMLMTNRLFILPLIEANESSEIFETPDA